MSMFLEIDNLRIDFCNYNNDFLLLKSDDKFKLRTIGKAIFEQKFDFVSQVIVTEVEICLQLNDKFNISKLQQLQNISQYEAPQPVQYTLPIYFENSEDWRQVEKVTGYSKSTVISKLQNANFSIVMFGFLPGFLYLEGLEKSLHVARKSIPSKHIAANSLAIGGQYLGFYALNSPGGWHVVGKSPISVLQIPQIPPVIFSLNDRLRFVPIQEKEYNSILNHRLSLEEYNAQTRDS